MKRYVDIAKMLIGGCLLVMALWGLASVLHVERIPIAQENIQKTEAKGVTEYRIRLPELPTQENYCLMFKSRGNVVRVQEGEQELFSYGREYAASSRDVGRTYCTVSLRPNSSDVQVFLEAADRDASDSIESFELCREKEASRYYLTNLTLGFMPGLFYFVLGFCCISVAVIFYRKWELYRFCCFFGFILCCIAIELWDSGGHYMVFGIDPHRWNILFYLDCYILPLSCQLFSAELLKDKFTSRENRILYIWTLFCALYGGAVTLLVSTTRLRFCDFSNYYVILLGLCAIAGTYGIVLILKKKMLLLENGVAIICAFILWLLWALLLNSYPNAGADVPNRPRIDMETIGSSYVFLILVIFSFTR